MHDCPAGQLAGKICTVIDLGRQLPVEVWFTEDAKAHDTQFLHRLLTRATAKMLLILDRGVYDFEWWSRLIAQQSHDPEVLPPYIVIDLYARSWRIEEYHKVLKAGCQVERFRLSATGMKTLLGFYSVIAVDLLHLTYLQRTQPTR